MGCGPDHVPPSRRAKKQKNEHFSPGSRAFATRGTVSPHRTKNNNCPRLGYPPPIRRRAQKQKKTCETSAGTPVAPGQTPYKKKRFCLFWLRFGLRLHPVARRQHRAPVVQKNEGPPTISMRGVVQKNEGSPQVRRFAHMERTRAQHNHVRTWPHTSSGKTKKTWRVDGATDHVPWGAGQGYKKQNYLGVVTPCFEARGPYKKK